MVRSSDWVDRPALTVRIPGTLKSSTSTCHESSLGQTAPNFDRTAVSEESAPFIRRDQDPRQPKNLSHHMARTPLRRVVPPLIPPVTADTLYFILAVQTLERCDGRLN